MHPLRAILRFVPCFVLLAMLACAAVRAEDLGPVGGFTLKESKHFRIYQQTENDKDLDNLAEKTFKVCEDALVGLEEFFEGTREEPKELKVPLYFIDKPGDYEKIIDWACDQIANKEQAAQQRKILKRVTLFPFKGALIFHRAPLLRHPDGAKAIHGPVVHAIGKQLLAINMGPTQHRLPFFLTGGFGYYAEFEVTKEAKVKYVDFDRYYQETEGKSKITQSETLADDNWTKVLKYLIKKKNLMSLQGVMDLEISEMTPSGGAWAYSLASYSVSSKKNRESFKTFLEAFKTNGRENMLNDYVAAYGFESSQDLEKDWIKYVRSSRFK